jgi:hypothetical protein
LQVSRRDVCSSIGRVRLLRVVGGLIVMRPAGPTSARSGSQLRAVHVPRPQDRVRRPGLDGLLRGDILTDRSPAEVPADDGRGNGGRAIRVPVWALVLAVVMVIGTALGALAVFGGASLPEQTGPPVEELAVERTVLSPGIIDLTVRNTGPDPVQVGQVSSTTPTSISPAPPIRSTGSARPLSGWTIRGRTGSPTWSRCSPRPVR